MWASAWAQPIGETYKIPCRIITGQQMLHFMDVGPLLEEHTEPGSIIGITGGGNIGYFIHDRTVTNMDGLINSYPYFQALQIRAGRSIS